MRSSDWRWKDLAGDLARTDESVGAEWPHQDYAVAAQACAHSADETAKLKALCEDLETRFSTFLAWAPLERVARARRDTFASVKGCCWREVLCNTELSHEVWLGIYRLGVIFRASAFDSMTRRTAMIIQLVARQKLKAANGYFESSDESGQLESERKELLQRPYLPAFLAHALH
jgi:hypothetical protein